MLYPYTEITSLDPNNFYIVNSGSMISFPLELISGGQIKIDVFQTNITSTFHTQDFSLKVWISTTIGGNPIAPQALEWNAKRRPEDFCILFDSTISPPNAPILQPASPGNYYLNVLNLVNTRNAFAAIFA